MCLLIGIVLIVVGVNLLIAGSVAIGSAVILVTLYPIFLVMRNTFRAIMRGNIDILRCISCRK